MKKKLLMSISTLAFGLVLIMNFTFVNDSQASGISLKTVESVAMATGETGTGDYSGCYTNPYQYDCNSFSIGITIEIFGIEFSWGGGNGYNCNFTGVYGPPYNCTDISCSEVTNARHCVQVQ